MASTSPRLLCAEFALLASCGRVGSCRYVQHQTDYEMYWCASSICHRSTRKVSAIAGRRWIPLTSGSQRLFSSVGCQVWELRFFQHPRMLPIETCRLLVCARATVKQGFCGAS
ncbi:hypothetical protein EDD16DRAFT_941391 [Pisolithus croceorrhizus]|nr:hypothetical protein EDD16DRAFT_941391 [Pisolithus croceorrhizus]